MFQNCRFSDDSETQVSYPEAQLSYCLCTAARSPQEKIRVFVEESGQLYTGYSHIER